MGGTSTEPDKEEKLETCMHKVEKGLNLLAVTGIEDKLQARNVSLCE